MKSIARCLALLALAWGPFTHAACAGSSETDSCLVGDWRMSDGGPMAWMKQQASQAGGEVEFTEFSQTPVDPDGAMHFKADGSFTVDPIRTRMVGKGSAGNGPAMTMEVNNVTSSSGRWSVKNGTLNLCTDKQNMEGSTKISMAGMTHEMPAKNPGKQDTSFGYRCEGKTLETRFSVEGSGEITSQFERQ